MYFVCLKVYTKVLVQSDKFKTGKEKYVDENIVTEERKDVLIGRIPVMVKSDLCWMNEAQKGDCDFDLGGYFLVKGAEKVSKTLNFVLFLAKSSMLLQITICMYYLCCLFVLRGCNVLCCCCRHLLHKNR